MARKLIQKSRRSPKRKSAHAAGKVARARASKLRTAVVRESIAERGDDDRASDFFIVGIGASAGGLEALGEFLSGVSLDNMAFVVVQHLSPKHASVLSTLLARTTPLSVVTITDGMRIERNRVYVIPPNADLAILRGVLHLMPVAGKGVLRLPIDFFFRSLAEDQGARSIGIVLSGTGSDGTFGLKAIKEAGGLTFAQEPSSAQYDGMPQSAIDSGYADLTLPPKRIAEEVMRIGQHPYLVPNNRGRSLLPSDAVAKILVLIRNAFGHDLTYYKPTTIERRIQRRLAMHKLERVEDYIRYLQANAEELSTLYNDMLIGVTNFFRDPEVYEALVNKVFPTLFENRNARSPIRVWVPGCSTGEEPYSIAMCLLEYIDQNDLDCSIQVFGTDVDETSITSARRGIYPPNIALDVSPERLQKFFLKKDHALQISRRVREVVVFSTQNITKDAPFSRLDLVSCRNLLIYLQPPMQKKVMRIVHYALKPEGFLLLGTSETVGDSPELFSLVDRKSKIYRPKHFVSTAPFDMTIERPLETGALTHGNLRPLVNLASIADRAILEMYAPPGVVINADFEILHFRGRTGPYLEPSPGTATLNVLRLARPEMSADLRRAIHEAMKTNARAMVESKVVAGDQARKVGIEVLPILEPDTKNKCLLVLFHQAGTEAPMAIADDRESGPFPHENDRVQDLERELLVTKEYLQTTVEELESSNEELKSSNEELQSSNEELQSTNEELEASKEELQSSNEELTTINDELQNRMSELQTTNDDLHNVMLGLDHAVVIVGMDLRIRRFTHTAARLLNLIPTDIGRSLQQVAAFLGNESLDREALEVIQTLTPFQKHVRARDEQEYSLRILPYKTLEHTITGVVMFLSSLEPQS